MPKKTPDRSRRRSSRPTVLVVEANPGYRSAISQAVESAGGQFESVGENDLATRQLEGAKRFDMVIVGTSADSPITPAQVRKLRLDSGLPLIVLVESYDETKETLEIYKAGADQVLPKPFVPDALIGAIKAGMRQDGPVSLVPLATRIELGSLVFDAERRQVTGEEATVQLTKREWQLLSFFLSNPNQFFTAAEVTPQAWGPDSSAEQFRSYISRIRAKLSPFSKYCRLVTEKAKGYCLRVQAAG
jgi:two-component system response regulator MprA